MRLSASASLVILSGLLLACAGGIPSGVVKGSYPRPKTTYLGVTADVWYESALDANGSVFEEGLTGLRSLGKEATPFLIRLCDHYRDSQHRLTRCLGAINGRHVEEADLPFFTQFLGNGPAEPAPFIDSPRHSALHILRVAGPRAAGCLDQIRAYDRDDAFGVPVRDVIRVIEGADPQESYKKLLAESEEYRAKNPKK